MSNFCAGFNGSNVVSALHAAHAAGNSLAGVDIATGEPKDLTKEGIVDLYMTKW